MERLDWDLIHPTGRNAPASVRNRLSASDAGSWNEPTPGSGRSAAGSSRAFGLHLLCFLLPSLLLDHTAEVFLKQSLATQSLRHALLFAVGANHAIDGIRRAASGLVVMTHLEFA